MRDGASERAGIPYRSKGRDWILEFYYSYADLGKFKKNAGPDVSGAPFDSGITDGATGKLRANELIFALRYDFK